MGKWLLGAWLTIFVPFAGFVAVGGPGGGVINHLILHAIGIAFVLLSFWILVRLRAATPSRAVRVTVVGLIVMQALELVGHVGESTGVLLHGGLAADKSVFDDPVHNLFSYVTPPAILLAQVGLIVLSVMVAVVSRRATRARANAAA